MTTLRVIVDQMISRTPGGIGRYTEELTRALIETAPRGCDVTGVVSASPEPDYEKVRELLPGLSDLMKSPLARRELSLAWQYGFTKIPGTGMVHAPSLLAPLRRHDRINNQSDQMVITIHDVVPWTHPETLTPHGVTWHKAMAKRAQKYADAIVVDTHAVASQLAEIFDFGDRVRVISAAVSSKFAIPVDATKRAMRLELPERYILSVGTLEPRKGLQSLIRSLSSADDAGLPLLIAGPQGWGDLDVTAIAVEAGLEPDRVRAMGFLNNADLAVALDRATVFVFPSLAEGFGLPVIEAFSFGTPVVHSDDPAVLEVSAGAGVAVKLSPTEGYSERLAQAISGLVSDDARRERLRFAGMDRASAFSWKDSAEKVWQLHADL
ncbi:glycosyltransferase family 1 protein [Frigoribacterium sp. CG_9.8]|uniref:glycosyltransferase family 4 protein n=1 Tax=Frigoribacterium sp. CG_9.8 TaxID=2787733 RepID=UPI0018C9B631|nr:glycosyltransferase family 1 protein [Frigoribacterium sp. CG_9.8]MBG6106735.1 glycosyltransferase involved in cell wall biosynthesis [Frigoribacterium sp. CG_9.8]